MHHSKWFEKFDNGAINNRNYHQGLRDGVLFQYHVIHFVVSVHNICSFDKLID